MKTCLGLSLFFVFLIQPLEAAPRLQGVFTSVRGIVKVQKTGGKSRIVQKDSTVKEGDRVVTGKDSLAVVRLFDGSELSIDADSRVGFSQLEKPSVTDKILKFKLFFGKLLSQVQKLASSKSTFEVEAGGVVCGVRGTKFSMDYDPDKKLVTLDVFEGTVYGKSGKNSEDYPAGSHADFLKGELQGPKPPGGGQGFNFNGVMDNFSANDHSHGPGVLLADILGGGGPLKSLGLGGGASSNGSDVLSLPKISLPILGGLGNINKSL